jgi:hypothetical protein
MHQVKTSKRETAGVSAVISQAHDEKNHMVRDDTTI